MINVHFTSLGFSSWVVPQDWNNTNNIISCIGGGGSAKANTLIGGGGGGYASITNVPLTPGSTVYIYVGDGGYQDNAVTPSGQSGGNSWFNFSTNAAPSSVTQGVLATGGLPGGNGGGPGSIGSTIHNGGRGGTHGTLIVPQDAAGPGGGAGGPHGAGINGQDNGGMGGPGDAGFGGAGGTPSYASNPTLNAGQNGPDYGSGGGGAGIDPAMGGIGGVYGGGGGAAWATTWGVGASLGGQGIVSITYTPGPATPTPTGNTSNGGGGVCTCALPVFNPGDESTGSAKASQYYWTYGSWTDAFTGSSAHYDNNYNKLLTLTSDNDSVSYDNMYDTAVTWKFKNEQENAYSDYPRVWKSRSNELVDDSGTRSVWCRHRVTIANSLCLPDSEPSLGYVTCTTNLLYMDEQTRGYRLSYINNYGLFSVGDIVAQKVNDNTTVYGTVYQMDPNYIWINIPVGQFFGGMSVYNSSDPSSNAWVTAATAIDEKYSTNVFINQSRYISKSTVLATGQDAEDLQVYLSAYRPANANFKVYGKIINGNDPNKYSDRIWTRLTESNNTSTSFSSATNLNDFIEINYDLPVSQLLYGNVSGCNCSSNSLYVTLPSTSALYTGMGIYLTDPSTGAFNVRGVADIVNSSMIQLLSLPSFSNTTNVNVGVIPGLEDTTGAFLYDGNDNIVRYVTRDDTYFDSFNQFAVKIVPISDNPVIVPRVSTLSILALQAD